MDVKATIAEGGITEPKAELEPGGDIFLQTESVYDSGDQEVRGAYSIEPAVVYQKTIKNTTSASKS